MVVYTEPAHAGEFIVSEANGTQSREGITLLSGQSYKAGAVLGKITYGSAAAAAVAGGTGNGTLTLDATTPVLAGAKVGVYTVACIAAAANSGTFRVTDPDGFVLGDVDVGATFSNDVKFVIADGSADFVVGDKFSVTVSEGSGKYREWNPANTDGSQTVAGVLFDAVDATSADAQGVAIARNAEVVKASLVWFSGATDSQKAAGVAQMAAKGVIAR
ncbi:MAG TPA: head decoration protein [Azospirillaceae bacterium]|nr:head decoration protein [Azospirillaceae bacterium]